MKLKEVRFDKLDSTQAYAKKNLSDLEKDSCVVYIANEQTQGKDTNNRQWISPPNVNIYATYAFIMDMDKEGFTK